MNKKRRQNLSSTVLAAALGCLLFVAPAAADFVINDDLIVTFSACVGNDCVNGENFGFDTIRLKENNTRIKFDDTSNSGSFPRNDWQLTANDSINGGAEKFSIDDITNAKTPFTVEANAPSHSLYVDDGGRIGFGTSTPVVELHVKDGDSPTLRLEQDGSSGFTAQTWDVAGNEANFFVRDVTNGSRLSFRIRPGAPESSIDIAASGNVGIGTDAPDNAMHIRRTDANPTRLHVQNTNAASGAHAEVQLSGNGQSWKLRANSANGQFNWVNETASTTPMKIAPSAVTNLLQLGVNGASRVDITGSLFINNVDNSSPDFVFKPGYELEGIEEHAAYMWENNHLPAVGAGKAQVDVVGATWGILEELEKAHIYIERLNEDLKDKDSELATLKQQNAELAERMARLEAAVLSTK